MWTPAALRTYALTTFDPTPSAISLQVSGAGPSPFAAPAGPTTVPSGLGRALASLSPTQAKAEGLLTSGIYGQPSTTSSSSAALQSSLESRLQATTQRLGSTLYKLTWKPWAMPSGRLRSRLVASAPRTSATGRTGWVTPTARDHKDTPGMALTGTDPDGSLRRRLDQLPRQAAVATHRRSTAFGQEQTGCGAKTASGALFDPAHSRWLMAFPAEWDACAPTATPSTLKRRSPSSTR